MPTTRELLAAAEHQLAAAGVATPRVDAALLLSHVTGRSRSLLGLSGTVVTEQQAEAFIRLVDRRAARIPLQHLTGSAPFRYLQLRVGPGVFVPRPETELMVDLVRGHLGSGAERPVLVDLCAGSGALALALATEIPGSRVVAVEVSAPAVEWARRNLADHAGAVDRAGSSLELVQADATAVAEPTGVLADLVGLVDVVVTNPPYVPDDAVPRDPEVRDHDPELALYGGPDGLAVVRPLARQAALLLRPGGLLVTEHADSQGEAAGALGVPDTLRALPEPGAAPAPSAPTTDDADPEAGRDRQPRAFREVADHLDLAGVPRHTTAIRAPARPDPVPGTDAAPDPAAPGVARPRADEQGRMPP